MSCKKGKKFKASLLTLPSGGASDTTAPTVTITSTETSPSPALPVPIAFTLSEISTDFAVGDLTLNGCTVANFAGSGTAYTAEATPSTPNGTFTIDIAAGAFHDAAGNGNLVATQFSFTSSAFALVDEFTTDRAAGAVNGTNAEPTGGARTVTDGNNKLSIASGNLVFSTGGVGGGNPGIWWPSTARAAGKALFAQANITAGQVIEAGFDSAQTGEVYEGVAFANTILQARPDNLGFNVATIALSTTYSIAVILRAAGSFMFIKGGTYSNWTLVYVGKVATNNPVYPGVMVNSTTAVGTFAFVRVPTNTITMTPLASDGFGTSESLGSTRGSGSAESGGTGLAYSLTGTWASNGSVASCSALSGGLGMASVNAGTANVVAEVVATRSAGTVGLVLRYTDANNYIKVVLDGTNLVVTEVVSGTPNTLGTTAVTYGATKRLIVSLDATKLRAYYGDAFIGAERTTAVTTGNNHGLFTDDTGATFDNFVVWAKGNGGEYNTALNKYINP